MKVRNRETNGTISIPSVACANPQQPYQATNLLTLPGFQSQTPAETSSIDFVSPGHILLLQNALDALEYGILVVNPRSGEIIYANTAACRVHGFPPDGLEQSLIDKIAHPDYLFLYQPKKKIDPTHPITKISTTHIHQDGSYLFFNASINTFQANSQPYILISLEHMQTPYHQPEENLAPKILQKRQESQIREQTILLEISQTLSSTLELDPELILEQMRKIICFDQAGLFKIQDSTLCAVALCGNNLFNHESIKKISLGSSPTPILFFNGHQTTRIPNIWNNDPEAIFLRSLFKGDMAFFLHGMQSWMWVPLVAKGKNLGGLGLAHEDLNYFTVHHSDLAQTIANQAAITMVNSELYEHAQMYASLQERQRLARNLHDAVNQSLFSANLIADVLPTQWEKDPKSGRESLEKLRRLTSGAMAEMRMMMVELRPIALTDTDLGNLLQLLCDAFTGRTNIPVHLSLPSKMSLPSDTQMTLYRICQESLNNIAKHSKAKSVDIQIASQANTLHLKIEDDGCGFDPSVASTGHYGISIIHEHAELIGGHLSIQSQIDHGTRIDLLWPVEQGRK